MSTEIITLEPHPPAGVQGFTLPAVIMDAGEQATEHFVASDNQWTGKPG